MKFGRSTYFIKVKSLFMLSLKSTKLPPRGCNASKLIQGMAITGELFCHLLSHYTNYLNVGFYLG